MRAERSIFVYPQTKEIFKKETNDYIKQLTTHLGKEYKVINGVTEIGLVDALSKFRKTDIYYFNWIENVPEKRFGLLQVALLIKLLVLCKIWKKKVIWFVHNNVSHDKKHYRIKKFIVRLMTTFSDLIISHSAEIKLKIPKAKLHIFHHPVEKLQPLKAVQNCVYDLLIWGAISPYKGVAEFVEFASASQYLKSKRILIIGKFYSPEYLDCVLSKKSDNITVIDKFADEEELAHLFSKSKYILFTYASPSVLSSAALCKTLSFSKEIIAPNVGSFKELGDQNLIYNYSSFADIESLMIDLQTNMERRIDMLRLEDYINKTSWSTFSRFTVDCINSLYQEEHIRLARKVTYHPKINQ